MKSKKIEIEIASPDLTDKMFEGIIVAIKSAIQEKHITDNLAFDIVVKENVETNHPIFPQYPYKEIDDFSPKKEIYPGYPNKITSNKTNH